MLKERGRPLLYCQPDRLVITDSQMIDMMRRAMIDNRKWGDFPLGMMIFTGRFRASYDRDDLHRLCSRQSPAARSIHGFVLMISRFMALISWLPF
jgi:hypothetical protein